jgi:hypothetical protein
MWQELAGVSKETVLADATEIVLVATETYLGLAGTNVATVPGIRRLMLSEDIFTSVICGQLVADLKAEEQVLLFLVLTAHPSVGTASVMKPVERVIIVKDYSALVLTTSVQRFLLLSALLALLTEWMALLGFLLDCVIWVIFLRATAEWWQEQ